MKRRTARITATLAAVTLTVGLVAACGDDYDDDDWFDSSSRRTTVVTETRIIDGRTVTQTKSAPAPRTTKAKPPTTTKKR